MLTITYTSKYGRWVESLNLHVWSSWSRASAFTLLYCVVPLLAVANLGFTALRHSEQSSSLHTSIALSALVFCAIMWGMRATNRRKQYGMLWPPDIKDQRNVLTFSEEGLGVFSNGIGESKLQWSALRKVVRNKRMILLYVGPCSFIVVPLENLTDLEEQELVSLIDKNVKATL